MKLKKKEKGVWVTQAQVKLTGSPDIARFLAQCVYWSECKTVEQRSGWFYKTRDEWQAETWLSRFKQEKARKKLKALGLLQERHERRNDGIRLWYRINLGLLNRKLNELGESSFCLDVQSRKTGVKEENSTVDKKGSVLTEPCSADDVENAKELLLLSGFSGTIVPDNNTAETTEYPCYSLNPEDYVFCHVFIYQFVKTQLPHYKASWQQAWQACGLTDPSLADAFCQFADDYGAALIDWYRTECAVDVPTLTHDDLLFSQIAGRRCYEPA